MDIFFSNDAVIFENVKMRNAADRHKMISSLSVGCNLAGLEVTFEEDYTPVFSIKRTHLVKDRPFWDTIHYKRVMNYFYWEAYQWLAGEFYGLIENPRQTIPPRRHVELLLQSNVDRFGSTQYKSVFLKALLASDFLDNCKALPEYQHHVELWD